MAMATPPKDIKFALMPNTFIEMKAKPTENGIDKTTTRLGRQPPRKINTTTATSRAPCQSAVVTVEAARLTSVP